MRAFLLFLTASYVQALHMKTFDPEGIMITMRSLVSEVADGRIPKATFNLLAAAIADIRTHLMVDLSCIVVDEDKLVLDALGVLSQCNADLLAEEITEAQRNHSAANDANDLQTCRESEQSWDDARDDECSDVCDVLTGTQICTPPTLPGAWIDEEEPCCNDTRSEEWTKLEDYMACLDDFQVATDSYFDEVTACVNRSDEWTNKKAECDAAECALAEYNKQTISHSQNKCEEFDSCWDPALENYNNVIASANATIANIHRQYDALETIECLMKAIFAGQANPDHDSYNVTGNVQEECRKCQAAPKAISYYPEPLICVNCPTPPPSKRPCTELADCYVCSAEYQAKMYGCPDLDACNLKTEQLTCANVDCTQCPKI